MFNLINGIPLGPGPETKESQATGKIRPYCSFLNTEKQLNQLELCKDLL